MKFAIYLIVFSALIASIGCESETKSVTVKGKVTFEGDPVTEGSIQFLDETTGNGGEVVLSSEGTYEVSLPIGKYNVLIIPPMLGEQNADNPNPRYKKVNNIPVKYQSSVTSGFLVNVSDEDKTHDFAMKK